MASCAPCANCDAPIVGRRSNAKYCSDTCGSAVRERRARARNPEYAAQRKERSMTKLRGLWRHHYLMYEDGSPTKAAIRKFGLPEGWNYWQA